AAAGGDVDDGVAALLDARQELAEDFRIGRRPSVLRIARVQVQDRGAGLGGVDRLGGNLVGRDRQRVRHGRRVDRAGNCAGDDDLVGELGHRRLLVFALYLVSGRPLGALGGGASRSANTTRRSRGKISKPKRSTRSPQRPFGAKSMTAIATAPSIIR